MSEKHLKPIYWGIFSVGGTVAALALAPLVLVICLLLPLGILGNADTFYQNVHNFIANPLVYVVLVGLIFTLLWHGVHRFYYILHDMHIHVGNGVRLFFYAIAIIAFVMCLYCGLIK
ncbi:MULTISPECIES: fumarate reductase subunit FrdD [unclassified Moraxella]|uniref:fumarate reductase subunit FrdD n=1 Tax=unclassified Moraxella TaxID=2685852 RepID=UPI003AF87531